MLRSIYQLATLAYLVKMRLFNDFQTLWVSISAFLPLNIVHNFFCCCLVDDARPLYFYRRVSNSTKDANKRIEKFDISVLTQCISYPKKQSYILAGPLCLFVNRTTHCFESLALQREPKRQLAAALDFSKVSKVKSGLDKFRSSFANPPLHLLWRSLDVTGKILQFPRMTAILSLLALFLLLACFPLTVGL